MFGRSREVLEALQGVRDALLGIRVALKVPPADEALVTRLDKLELSRATWEAEIEAQLLKSDSKYKAAAAAESRARTMVKFDDTNLDTSPPEGEEEDPPPFGFEGESPLDLPAGHVPGSEPEQLHTLHVGMETNTKARSVRAKFS